MSNILKKITAAISTFMIVLSIVGPVAGVNAAYSSSLEAANKLATVGVIVDKSANPADYRLGDNISRRELVKIAVLLSGAELNTAYAGKFSDVAQSDWAWKYAETALDNGLVFANATFSPSINVTNAEALKMIMNATGVEKVGSDLFWAKNYVKGGVAAGIVETFSDYDTAAQRGWIFKVAANAFDLSTADTSVDSGTDILDGLLDGLDGTDTTTDTGTDTTTTTTDTGTDTTTTTPSGSDVLTIALSADTPASASIPAGVSGIPVASYELTAGSEDVTVTSIVVKRKGLSDLDTLSGIAVFSSDGRASKAKDDSQNNNTEATLTLTNGFVVKAGETRALTLVANVNLAPGAANDEFALEVIEVVASTTAEKDGSLVGNSFKVGSVNAATLTVQQNGSVSAPKIGEEGVNVIKFQVKGSANEDILLKSLTFKADNSNAADDFANFKLLKGTTEVAATASMNGKYVTFTLGDGMTITKNKIEKFTVIADVVAGAADVIKWSVEKNLDISAEDTRYGYGAAIDITAVDLAGDIGSFIIKAGELTLVDIDPASDKIRENKNDVVLGKIKVTNVAGKNLELQQFAVKTVLTPGTAFVDDGAGVGGVANNRILDGTEGLTLAKTFENFELYNEDTGSSYALDLSGNVYQDLDLSMAIPQGVTNFVLRADTKDNIINFDKATVAVSMDTINASSADGIFFAVETENDKQVTDLTPSSLNWKLIKGSESGATLTISPLSDLAKVRGAKDVVGLQFEVEADVSAAVKIDELKVYVQSDTGGAPKAATNALVSKVSLYKGSVSDANLLDNVSGSNLAGGYATFNGFIVDIAANAKQTFIVTVDYVDGADASLAANSPYTLKISSADISAQDEDSTDVTVGSSIPTLISARDVTINDFGNVTLIEDANNDDNVDVKTILGGTSKKFFSIDVQSVNENVDVDTVEFTVDKDVKNAVGSASLYLGDTLIATNSNADITSAPNSVITFKNLSTLIIPQETKELKIALNTEAMGFEKVGATVKNIGVLAVALRIIEGVDSGKTITDVTDGAITSDKIADIVPAVVTPSSVQTLSASSAQAKFRLTADFGTNTVDLNNSTPNVAVKTITFSTPGATAWVLPSDYVLYEDGKSGEQIVGKASGSNVVFDFTDKNGDGITGDLFANGTISTNKTYVIVPTLTTGDTASLTLLKTWVMYNVPGIGTSPDITTQLSNEIDLGTRTIN